MTSKAFGMSMEAISQQMIQNTRQSHGYSTRRKSQSLKAWQNRLRKRLLELLAIDGKTRQPPQVRFVESTECEGYVRHRGYMLAEDGLDVPLFLLEPDPKPTGRMSVCIAAHGHGPGTVSYTHLRAHET